MLCSLPLPRCLHLHIDPISLSLPVCYPLPRCLYLFIAPASLSLPVCCPYLAVCYPLPRCLYLFIAPVSLSLPVHCPCLAVFTCSLPLSRCLCLFIAPASLCGAALAATRSLRLYMFCCLSSYFHHFLIFKLSPGVHSVLFLCN